MLAASTPPLPTAEPQELESMPAPCLHAPAHCHSFQISPGCRGQGCQHITPAEQGRAQLTNNYGKTKQKSKCFWRSEVSYQLDNDCPNTHPAGLHTKTHLFHQKCIICELFSLRMLMSCCLVHILTSFQYWKLSNLVQRSSLLPRADRTTERLLLQWEEMALRS